MSSLGRPGWVLTDVEGTTTPIAFVRDVLFPYARAAMPALLRDSAVDPEVAAELAAIAKLAPGQDPLRVLLGWIDQDAKVAPLKTLQGILWRGGYAGGAILGQVYDDVPVCLRAWRDAGIRLAVYSSGSVEAQKLIFGHSTAGNIAALFDAHFDTAVGGKREAASYRGIASRLDAAPASILFLSDVEAELDAAREAGLATCQLVRPQDGTVASSRHPTAADFAEVARNSGL